MQTILLWCLAFLLLPYGAANATGAKQQTLPPIAKPFMASDFSLPGEDGKTYRLSDFRGKVVVLNFWATWCPPCRFEMPSLERLWQKVKDQNIVILAINVGEDSDTIFEFGGNYPTTFPIPMDRNGDVIKRYPVKGLPTTYIVSPDGRVTHRAVGSREWDSKEMISALKAQRK
jgi:thiol-disulfide isomerase/thioredoxin